MLIAGIVKNSFVDYPGMIAFVVFMKGCNMDCYYCHNRHIIDGSKCILHEENSVVEIIKQRIGFIDAVVISGGEPTLQKGLAEFAAKIKALGLKVKLDTNGMRPDVIQALLDQGLLDFIAMDIKATWAKYAEITHCEADTDAIKRSIAIIEGSGIPHEFRTVRATELTDDDIAEIRTYVADGTLTVNEMKTYK